MHVCSGVHVNMCVQYVYMCVCGVHVNVCVWYVHVNVCM